MRKRIIINTSNLQKGGALQVASSFIEEASRLTYIDFYIISGRASSEVIHHEEFSDFSNIRFFHVNIHPGDSVLAILKFRRLLANIESKVKPDGVITVFGPCYWKPEAPHIMGFANGYLLYQDTYFFRTWNGWKSLGYQLKKEFQKRLLKNEASSYWTETEDSKRRLAIFLGKSLNSICVASNNCSHFFRESNFEILDRLPQKKGKRLLYISSYYPHKGFELIPPILQKLIEKDISVELIITINENDFKRIFRDFSNVINLGSVAPKYCPFLYQDSDIVFVPSLLETFTAIYPEAMFSKKPILTTNLPFARDICKDAALYFDPESVDDAVNKIEQLLSNQELKNKLVENGLKRIMEFDLPEERFKKVLKFLIS